MDIMPLDDKNPYQSARLTYRALEPEDETLVHTLESDPLSYIMSQLALKKPQAKRDTKQSFREISENCLLGVVVCVIEANGGDEDGKAIGVLNLTSLAPSHMLHRHTEMGLGLLPAYQGKGYGSEAIRWTLDWAFDMAGMHRVMIKAFEYNYGARKLYERLGFKHEGIAREMFWHNGRFWDDYEYGMLDREWRELRTQQGQA